MDAVIFAKAGLERLNLLPENSETLYWMLPAPAQGVMGIVCRGDDMEIKEICARINHRESFITSWVERQFLKTLMGGCSVPISALAHISGNELELEGAMHSFDGATCFRVHNIMMVSEWENAGKEAAEKLLLQVGATQLIDEIRNKKWDEEGALD
jgi:hydroxymethylbilane synthase